MGKYFPALVCGLVVAAAPVHAQDNAVAVVQGWYRQYLHRTSEPSGLSFWVNSLRSGVPPQQVLSQILGSDEYYSNAGGTAAGFVQALFWDTLGRAPNRREYQDFMNQMATETPQDVAYNFLLRYG